MYWQAWFALNKAVVEGNIKDVSRLLRDGASIEVVDEMGRTPLHLAILHGRLKIARKLLKCGANVETCDAHSWTPCHQIVALLCNCHGDSYMQALAL